MERATAGAGLECHPGFELAEQELADGGGTITLLMRGPTDTEVLCPRADMLDVTVGSGRVWQER